MPLTKHQIAEYYSDPHVRDAILSQIQNRPVMVMQDRGDTTFFRRNTPAGKPISILEAKNDATNPKDLAWYTERRYSEFHPAIGKNTRVAWVDVDPGKDVDFKDVKDLTARVVTRLQRLPEISDTRIAYSGGRGFHIRGDLYRKTPTDKIRQKIEAALKPMFVSNVVNAPPKDTEVRLDTSTLHNKGSIRAEYSLNSATGRVAVPLTERELRNFQPYQADVSRILKEKEFAPGIPRSRRAYALPAAGTGQHWTMVLQEHDAAKAGLHWDLRLVDPATAYAHSWALPKARLPDAGEKLLAIRTPTHTEHYALNFGAEGPQNIGKGYGKGTVKIVIKEPVLIEEVTDSVVKFKRVLNKDTRYTMFRTNGDKWLIQQSKASVEKTAFYQGYAGAMHKFGLDSTSLEADTQNDTPEVQSFVGLFQQDDTQSAGGDRGREPAEGQRTAVERRLDRPVAWDSPVSLSSDRLMGQTRPIFAGNIR